MADLKKVFKRDGRMVDFNEKKIFEAIKKAYFAVYPYANTKLTLQKVQVITNNVLNKLRNMRFERTHPSVEEIQNVVEDVILDFDRKLYKAYALYRSDHSISREENRIKTKYTKDLFDNYIKTIDWKVNENANMGYSLQGLNNYLVSHLTESYWLNHIYTPEIREAHEDGSINLHDLVLFAPYCCGWDLQQLLLDGFRGVEGKTESAPPKHFRSALGQMVNFLYTLQGESAGAQAFSNIDTLLAPFIREDNLTYEQVRQAIQEHIFQCNVPTRVGFQTPFINYTLDLECPERMKNQPVIIGGEFKFDKCYGDYQEEMNMFNRAFAEIMMEGDRLGRQFSFPIPTYNLTKNFNWDNPVLDVIFEMTSKYGIPSFCNYINSDLSPEDATSMCCRLRLDRRELMKRGGGGQFGSAPLTGSIGVVTINMPRIGYLSNSEEEFFERLRYLMDLSRESLSIKREVLEYNTSIGLYPYAKFYLRKTYENYNCYWANHFSTIGINGMNECLQNFFGKDVTTATEKGKDFTIKVLNFMREVIAKYQAEEDIVLYNLEATPAEGTSYKLALKDKQKYPDIITAGFNEPYYTNSTQLPVSLEIDVFDAIKLQEDIQSLYTGGTTFHTYLGERIPTQVCKQLVKKIAESSKLPYFTISPTFSICPEHGYIPGEHFSCPTCHQEAEVWARVVGFNRPIKQWNKGKKEEFRERALFKI